jgi:hypothetical protein
MKSYIKESTEKVGTQTQKKKDKEREEKEAMGEKVKPQE